MQKPSLSPLGLTFAIHVSLYSGTFHNFLVVTVPFEPFLEPLLVSVPFEPFLEPHLVAIPSIPVFYKMEPELNEHLPPSLPLHPQCRAAKAHKVREGKLWYVLGRDIFLERTEALCSRALIGRLEYTRMGKEEWNT